MGVIFYKNKKYTGSGARLLSELLDVLISNPSNGQVPVYNSTTHKWENQNAPSSVEIDDTTTSASKVWSSTKTNSELVARDGLGAKNLLPNNATSQTINGVTFTVNADGSVTVSGKNNSTTNPQTLCFFGTGSTTLNVLDEAGLKTNTQYILTGCPSGGGADAYALDMWIDGSYMSDYGNGCPFIITSSLSYIRLRVAKNYEFIEPLTFYPMVRHASISDDTYQPYAKTNKELTDAHKVTNILVDITSGWTQDSTSQSGSTFYKKQITLNHIYVDSPTVEIGAYNAVLPTTAQQTTYDYLRYVTVDDTVPCIYLYADENMMSDSDRTSFYIDVEGVD